MTTQEALTKWCPHMRAVPNAPHYAAGNRFDGQQPPIFQCLCIASDCMMWDEGATELYDGKIQPAGRCGLTK